MRHSAAHLAAQAIMELFPETLLTIGPVTETGFFYDILPPRNLKEDDIPVIEKRMHELVKKNYKFVGKQMSKEEAGPLFTHNRFKQELIKGIDAPEVSVYWQGDFYDLCRGGHVDELGQIKYFKLTGLSGSYWRADRNGQPLQRIHGVAFLSQEEMDEYFRKIEEAKTYDHRVLGKQLDLFSFHDECAGMAFFHPKGLRIYNKLIEFIRGLLKDDYQEIKTPLIVNESVYRTSGHYDFYKDNMYQTVIDEVPHWVRPMNCPSCALFVSERPHSYRELPLRYSEFGHVHRYELSGVLHGLFRVRSFTQDDAHIFCTLEQVGDEVSKMIGLAKTIYARFGFNVQMKLATRPDKFMGSIEWWDSATDALKTALESHGIEYEIAEGDGAFYGPKIDMKIKDAMEREWQCGTIQVDPNLARNFKLEYVKADQTREHPIVLHRAILGSLERFIGVITEHFKGHFPFWLAPEQVRVLTITSEQQPYAHEVATALKAIGLYVEVDSSNDKITAQIKRAQLDKIPWMLVLGAKELENKTVTLRHNNGQQEFGLTLEQVIAKAQELLKA